VARLVSFEVLTMYSRKELAPKCVTGVYTTCSRCFIPKHGLCLIKSHLLYVM
jgi:hypothetical protein